MAAAAGNYEAADGRFASQARLAFTAVDTVLQLEKSFFAVGAYVIGDGRPAEFDGLPEDCLDRSKQAFQIRFGNGRGAALGTDSDARQRLVGVDVAHAAQKLLIQQSTLDGGFPSAK